MIPTNQLAKLEADGWCTFDLSLAIDTRCVAETLGVLTPSRFGGALVDRLVPTQMADGSPRSLTAIYGIGEFPYHTDSAYVLVPPRYLLLRMVDGITDRPTRLLDTNAFDLSEAHLRVLERDVWLVNGGRRRFLASVVSTTLVEGSRIVRFDRHCMRPAHPKFGASAELMSEQCRVAIPIEVHWTVGLMLIIDNWRMLHSRGASSNVMRETRVLERALISTLAGES